MSGNIKTIIWGALVLLTGGLFLAEPSLGHQVDGMAFMFLLALIFVGIASRVKWNWMAIIPAGIFATIGVCVLVENVIPHQDYPMLQNVPTLDTLVWVMFLGLAGTFAVVWALRKTQPTDWAKYPMAGLLALAVLAIAAGSWFREFYLQTTALVIGVVVLLVIVDGVIRMAGQHAPRVNG